MYNNAENESNTISVDIFHLNFLKYVLRAEKVARELGGRGSQVPLGNLFTPTGSWNRRLTFGISSQCD